MPPDQHLGMAEEKGGALVFTCPLLSGNNADFGVWGSGSKVVFVFKLGVWGSFWEVTREAYELSAKTYTNAAHQWVDALPERRRQEVGITIGQGQRPRVPRRYRGVLALRQQCEECPVNSGGCSPCDIQRQYTE